MIHTVGKSAYAARTYILGVCALFFIPYITHAEFIESFLSEIDVRADSSYEIEETIQYVFTEDRHGIRRCIPTEHSDPPSSPLKKRFIDIRYTDVTMDDESVPYVVEETKEEVCVKIGDPNTLISGLHTYHISYVVEGAVSYTSRGNADIYWDATGEDFQVSAKNVRVELRSSDGVLLSQNACYHGKEGDNQSCVRTKEGGAYVFSGGVTRPGEIFTIAQALDTSKIERDVRESFRWFLYAILGALVASVVLIMLIYRYMTEHKTDNAIIPQYEPFPDVKPMYMGVLFDGSLDPKDITAGFIYLAQRGYIKIRATEKKVLFLFEVDDFEVTYTKELDTSATPFERELISLIFGKSPKLQQTVSLTDLKNNHAKARENQKTIQALKKTMVESLQKDGFFTTFGIIDFVSNPLHAVFLIGPFAFVALFLDPRILALLAAFYLLVGVALSFPKRSKRGYEAREYLEGFKDFLRVTEKERYIFHNAPKKSPEQFMEFLPYAIAFGVEKEWAKTFEDITIPEPDWYQGTARTPTFSASGLTQSLAGFSTAMAQSGTSSSSSGGGSAGGGSGGGSVGSW